MFIRLGRQRNPYVLHLHMRTIKRESKAVRRSKRIARHFPPPSAMTSYERKKHSRLLAIRGLTPPALAEKLYNAQITNPVRWSDQNLALEYGMSLPKIRAILLLEEQSRSIWKEYKLDPVEQRRVETHIKERFGVFSVESVKNQHNYIGLLQAATERRATKYEISTSALNSLMHEIDNTETLALEDKALYEEIFRTGIVPNIYEENRRFNHTVTLRRFEREAAEEERKYKEEGEYTFTFT